MRENCIVTERVYTLDEAKDELARKECARNGHDYRVISTKTFGGAGRPLSVVCDECGEHWKIAPKLPSEEP